MAPCFKSGVTLKGLRGVENTASAVANLGVCVCVRNSAVYLFRSCSVFYCSLKARYLICNWKYRLASWSRATSTSVYAGCHAWSKTPNGPLFGKVTGFEPRMYFQTWEFKQPCTRKDAPSETADTFVKSLELFEMEWDHVPLHIIFSTGFVEKGTGLTYVNSSEI